MAERSLMPNRWTLTIPERMFGRLHEHLFPGDRDEHAAVILAGLHNKNEMETRLLSRELHLAVDGVDWVPGQESYRTLKAEFIRDLIAKCDRERLVYLAIHNHPCSGFSVDFSDIDRASHEWGYPSLLDIVDGLPVGALVFGERSIAGDIWLPDRTIAKIKETYVIGYGRSVILPQTLMVTDEEEKDAQGDEMHHRQTLAFHPKGHKYIKESKVAIIGLGGVGSIVAELLGRSGVGNFVLIDSEAAVMSNLSRLVGADIEDVSVNTEGTWLQKSEGRVSTFISWLLSKCSKGKSSLKVDMATKNIMRANPKAKIIKKYCDFQYCFQSVLDCDYIFLAADSHIARLLFNVAVHQYLIPGVQIGSSFLEKDNISTVSLHVTPENGCLLCNGFIDPYKVEQDLKSDIEKKSQHYGIDSEESQFAPSVISLNAVLSSEAVNNFLFYMAELKSEEHNGDYLYFHPQRREFSFVKPRKSPKCTECGKVSESRFARGDLEPDLPIMEGLE